MKRYPSFRRSRASLILVACVFPGCFGRSVPPDPETSVLLILIDALRADHVGVYGYSRSTTPNIDSLAATAVRFENAFSTSSWTKPAIASLFTGLYPIEHGALRYTRPLRRETILVSGLSQDHETMAESFSRMGYRTAAFVGNPFLSRIGGLGQGFQEYLVSDFDAGTIRKEFFRWRQGIGGDSFFAYLHFMEPHWPYKEGLARRELFGVPEDTIDFDTVDWTQLRRSLSEDPASLSEGDFQFLVALYDGCIRLVDEVIGDILDEIREEGRLDRLLLVIAADHGEEFRDHGGFGHSRTLYDELLRIPLILRFPNGEFGGRVVEKQVQLIDVFPSLLDVLGRAESVRISGRSLMPLLGEQTFPVPWREYAFGEYMHGNNLYRQSVRTPDFKLIRSFNRKDPRGAPGVWVPARLEEMFAGSEAWSKFYRLYDLRNDSREARNQFLQFPELVRELGQVLDHEWIPKARVFDQREREPEEVPWESLERFRDLGYLE